MAYYLGDVGLMREKEKREEGGAPTGIRTPVSTLKGLRPSPLDDGGGDLA